MRNKIYDNSSHLRNSITISTSCFVRDEKVILQKFSDYIRDKNLDIIASLGDYDNGKVKLNQRNSNHAVWSLR
jgi:hypothetical protein